MSVGRSPAESAQARAARAARAWPSPTAPRFVSAGAYSAPSGRHAAPHRYAVWKLSYYRSGHIDALVGDTTHAVVPGTVLIVPPHVDHAERAHTDYSNYYVLVHADRDRPWPRSTADDGARRLGDAFAALVREGSTPDEHTPIMIDALVRQIDVTLSRATTHRHDTPARVIVQAVDRLLEERHAEHLRVDRLADEAGVSVSTLRAYFVAELGMSPRARLLDIRRRHAVTLLETSTLTLASVAERCGFYSESHLSRHLRAALDCTPGEVRARFTR